MQFNSLQNDQCSSINQSLNCSNVFGSVLATSALILLPLAVPETVCVLAMCLKDFIQTLKQLPDFRLLQARRGIVLWWKSMVATSLGIWELLDCFGLERLTYIAKNKL